MRLIGSAIIVGALLAGLLPTSCAAPTGDFGRPARSYVNDTVLPAAGYGAAWLRDEPVSHFQMTDAEEELRDRTYRFVMPIHRRGFLARTRAELVRTRIWPDSYYTVDPATYYGKLLGDHFRSEVGRYSAMLDEITADNALLDSYLAVVNDVYADDAARLAALDRVYGLTAEEEDAAIARVYENRRVGTWAVAALRWRVASYGYALERSRIEVPSEWAVQVELALNDLSYRVEALAAAVEAMVGAPPGTPLVVKG
jgi:hypothetical protein